MKTIILFLPRQRSSDEAVVSTHWNLYRLGKYIKAYFACKLTYPHRRLEETATFLQVLEQINISHHCSGHNWEKVLRSVEVVVRLFRGKGVLCPCRDQRLLDFASSPQRSVFPCHYILCFEEALRRLQTQNHTVCWRWLPYLLSGRERRASVVQARWASLLEQSAFADRQ